MHTNGKTQHISLNLWKETHYFVTLYGLQRQILRSIILGSPNQVATDTNGLSSSYENDLVCRCV